MNGSELEVIALWTVALNAVLYGLFGALFFILLRTGSVEVTGSVRPGSRWKNGAAGANGGKTAPKTDSPRAGGPSLTPAEVAALTAPDADGTVPGA